MPDDLADLLRALPSLTGAASELDPATVPDDPLHLLRRWLIEAIDAGVPEPHAAVLSTVDRDGPDARVLLLKAVAADALGFAGSAAGPKGEQLKAAPTAALTFWWQPQARSIRVRGAVRQGTEAEHRADFLARSADSRAAALVAHGDPLTGRARLEADAAAAREAVEAQPDLLDPAWRRWWLVPDRIEFWQGRRDRLHVRVAYDRADEGWRRLLLRP